MHFGFLIFPELEELDLVGPWEMMTNWSKYFHGPECIMIAEHREPVVCSKGMIITPHVTFTDCPELEYLLIPGGMGTWKEVDNPALIRFVVDKTAECKALLSVCTGSFILHRAGLLAGQEFRFRQL